MINLAILIGGTKEVRRLLSAMHTKIVMATLMHHKKKNLVSEYPPLFRITHSKDSTVRFPKSLI